MKTITIAFDVDGTLIESGYPASDRPKVNERIRSLLVMLAHMKNTKIIVWSGGGELYARQIANMIGIEQYVDGYASKNLLAERDAAGHPRFAPNLKPDIAIDDIQDCDLGTLNLIVREK